MPFSSDEELDIKLASADIRNEEQQEGSLTVDVFRNDGEIVIQSTIAGASEKDLDISLLNDMVTIKGRRQPTIKVAAEDYHYQELYWGPFSRTVILPEQVDADAATASMKNGLLTIRLPTMEKSQTKKLKVELA